MAFEGSNLSAADIAAVTGNNGMFDGMGNGGWWMMVLFLFAFMNNGYWGGGNNGGYVTQGELQAGLNQQTLQNGQSNLMQTLANNRSEIQGQIAALQMGQQECCCNTREAIANLRYDVATQAAQDRADIQNALRDVLVDNNAKTQRILDQMCQDKIDAKNELIAELRTQLNMANLAASQNAQTSAILADNARQTVALEQYLNPTPIPAYVVANPNCCNAGWNGCGCSAA